MSYIQCRNGEYEKLICKPDIFKQTLEKTAVHILVLECLHRLDKKTDYGACFTLSKPTMLGTVMGHCVKPRDTKMST